VWTQEHQTTIEEVMARLVVDPVLACPDFDKPFILQTDATDYGIGAILTQETERGEKVHPEKNTFETFKNQDQTLSKSA